MNTGIVLIVAGVVVLLLVGLVLRPRLPAAPGLVFSAAAGAALGAGALLVQDHASAADWAIVVPVTAFLGAAHVRIVFGAFRRPGPPPATAPVGAGRGESGDLPSG